jgi:hypothetical protein
MEPKINSVEVHPQLSNNGHPLDGALVGAGSLWAVFTVQQNFHISTHLGSSV